VPRENPPKFQFQEPNPLVDGIIAQISLKKYFFPEFWAYQSLGDQWCDTESPRGPTDVDFKLIPSHCQK